MPDLASSLDELKLEDAPSADHHDSVSHEAQAPAGDGPIAEAVGPRTVFHHLNNTGNILTTVETSANGSVLVPQELQDLLGRVYALLAMVSQAVAAEGCSLYDQEVWAQVLMKSGLFSPRVVDKQELTVLSEVKEDFVERLKAHYELPRLDGGKTAQQMDQLLGSLHHRLLHERELKQLGHVLIRVANTAGNPTVSVQLWLMQRVDEILQPEADGDSTAAAVGRSQVQLSTRRYDLQL